MNEQIAGKCRVFRYTASFKLNDFLTPNHRMKTITGALFLNRLRDCASHALLMTH
jgi:hypothetical protein